MDALTKNVVDKLLEWGADLVGIAPVDRFAEAPEGHRPTDFMPECKSVISIGLHLFNEMADIWGDQADWVEIRRWLITEPPRWLAPKVSPMVT